MTPPPPDLLARAPYSAVSAEPGITLGAEIITKAVVAEIPPVPGDRKKSLRNLQYSELATDPRWLRWIAWPIVLLLCSLRFFYLNADFPNNTRWMIDQAKYTDEGWWANAAVMHHLLGHWNVPGDYNPAAAVPVWPLLLSAVFHFTGVNIFAARAVSVLLSVATLAIIFLLVRRYSGHLSEMPATLSVLLLAASPFAFVFSRIAILDTFVVFQFCLLLLVASFASEGRLLPLAALVFLVPAILLTKTTAVLLLPAVLWIGWSTTRAKKKTFLSVALLVGILSALALKAYVSFVIRSGFAVDYRYFFVINHASPIVWSKAFATIADILQDGMWIDRILYPLGLLTVILASLWVRGLWRNPLFAASSIACACQAIFIFSRQDDFPPRYFQVILVPLVICVALAVGETRMRHPKAYLFMMAAVVISLALNIGEIVSFLHNRTFQFYDAATSIATIVNKDPNQNRLILGVSGSQISLMTGIPSINDVYGTEDLAKKLLLYRPGWYLVWNEISADEQPALSPFQLEKFATYPVFDDDERNTLILYRMVGPPK